jgi:hypothetical protein
LRVFATPVYYLKISNLIYTGILHELVYLEHTEDGNGVHEGGVKLKVGVVRADVITT